MSKQVLLFLTSNPCFNQFIYLTIDLQVWTCKCRAKIFTNLFSQKIQNVILTIKTNQTNKNRLPIKAKFKKFLNLIFGIFESLISSDRDFEVT